MWLQQDNATCHTARETLMNYCKIHFSCRLISRFSDQNGPPRSGDLKVLGFLLLGYIKSQVYFNKLKANEVASAV